MTYYSFVGAILNALATLLSGKMDLNILFIFAQELLEKLEDTHLRAHIISTFVAIDDSTTTSRVDWTCQELVEQLSLFTSSPSNDTTFSLGFARKQ